MTAYYNALRFSGVLTLLFLFSQAFVPASAATTYTITLQTSAPSYSGEQPILITGVVSPALALANTAIIVTIKDSAGSVADINEILPGPTNGSFSYTSIPGGNTAWTSGTFFVNATWAGNGATASMVTTFTYSPTATTTATTTITTVTTIPATSATSTTTTATAPEFPSSALAIVALVAVALVAVLSRRVALRPPGSLGR